MTIMAVDKSTSGDGWFFTVTEWNQLKGTSKLIAHGKVKSKGWLTRTAKKYNAKGFSGEQF